MVNLTKFLDITSDYIIQEVYERYRPFQSEENALSDSSKWLSLVDAHFWFLADLSISNAVIRMNESACHKKMTMLNFRMHLTKQLSGNMTRKLQNSEMHLPKHGPQANCLNFKFKHDRRRHCSIICTCVSRSSRK